MSRDSEQLADALGNVTRTREKFKCGMELNATAQQFLIGVSYFRSFSLHKTLAAYDHNVSLMLGPYALTLKWSMPKTVIESFTKETDSVLAGMALSQNMANTRANMAAKAMSASVPPPVSASNRFP